MENPNLETTLDSGAGVPRPDSAAPALRDPSNLGAYPAGEKSAKREERTHHSPMHQKDRYAR